MPRFQHFGHRVPIKIVLARQFAKKDISLKQIAEQIIRQKQSTNSIEIVSTFSSTQISVMLITILASGTKRTGRQFCATFVKLLRS